MTRLETLVLLERVHLRRRKVAEARMRSVEDRLRRQEDAISAMKRQASDRARTHERDVLDLIRSAGRAAHYPSLSSSILARGVRHADEMILLRFDTLRAEESLGAIEEERARQRAVTVSATQKTVKFERLIEEETAREELRQEASDEEAALEAQSKGGDADA